MPKDNAPKSDLTIREGSSDISVWLDFTNSVSHENMNRFVGEIVALGGVVIRNGHYNQTQLDVIESQGGFDEDEE